MQVSLKRSGLPRVAGQKIKPSIRATHVVRVAEAEKVVEKASAKEEKPEVKPPSFSAPVDFGELSDIIRLVNETDIVELDMKSKRFNLTVRKKEALKTPEPIIQQVQMPQMQMPQMQMQQMPAAAPAPAPAPAAAAAAPAAAAPAPQARAPAAAAAAPPAGGVEMVSPMGGTFYRAPAPGEPAFVKEGDRVKKGQIVGLIEAMKLMNEIEAEMSGEVVAIIAENGKPISTGQPLFLVKP